MTLGNAGREVQGQRTRSQYFQRTPNVYRTTAENRMKKPSARGEGNFRGPYILGRMGRNWHSEGTLTQKKEPK